MEIDFLVAAANEVFRVAVLPLHPSHQNVVIAAGITCKALNRLTSDLEFSNLLEQMTLRRNEYGYEFNQITSSIHHFRDFFLVRDLQLLQASGLDPAVLDAIRKEATDLADEVKNESANYSSILQRMSLLRDDACFMSTRLNFIQPAEARRRRIRKLAGGIAGSVVVAANATPFALEYLSPAGTTVSNALGSALIGAALAL
jgi:hypothetical protein